MGVRDAAAPGPTDTGPVLATGGAAGLGRSSAVMAAGTALSRITGFARSVAIIAALGTFTGSDAFTIANTIPNNLYILVAGGALNAVFIPSSSGPCATTPTAAPCSPNDC